jgi:hypothetical protein
MHSSERVLVAFAFAALACQRPAEDRIDDTSGGAMPADVPAAAPAARTPAASTDRARPVDSTAARPDSTAGLAAGKEPGTIPATPTPTVTSESAIAAMRSRLERMNSASTQELERARAEHSKMLGDLLTTMRVEVQALTSPAKNSWLAMADSAEGDLNRLALADGDALRTAFRVHRDRVLRLLDDFRTLVPPTP